MIKEMFALFQPGEWQDEGLVIPAPVELESHKPRIARKMDKKWMAAATAATVAVVALSATLAAAPNTFRAAGSTGAVKRIILGVEDEGSTAVISNAEIPANYWANLSREVSSWPRLSVASNVEDEQELDPLL